MRTVGSVGEATARQVRRAAADLIAEHGFEAMSVRQLAKRVGLTASSLYNHFGSKQDLLSGLLHAVMLDLLAAVDRRVLNNDDPLIQLQAFVHLHIQFHVDRKNDVVIATTELRSLTPENLKKIIRLRNRYEAILISILKRGAASGVFNIADTKLAALALIPMLTGITQWYRSGSRTTRDTLIERSIEMTLSLVGAPRVVYTALPEEPVLNHETHVSAAELGVKPRRASSRAG